MTGSSWPSGIKLPFLEAISWFDVHPDALSAREMLDRYEASWKYLGVLGDLGVDERAHVEQLIHQFGSTIELPSP